METSWVVVLIPKDLHHLPGLFRAIEMQSLPVGELVLVTSGLTRAEGQAVDVQLSRYGFPSVHLRRPSLHSAGSNRNRGVKVASREFVSFMDADDFPHPDRNKVLTERAIELANDHEDFVIFHSYNPVPRDQDFVSDDWLEEFHGRDVTAFEEARTLPLEKQEQIRVRAESRRRNKNFATLRFMELPNARIHHSPITAPAAALRRFPVPSRPLDRDEDVAYCNSAFLRGAELVFLDTPLILYRVGWNTPPDVPEVELLVPFKLRLRMRSSWRKLERSFSRFFRRLRRFVASRLPLGN